MMDGFVAVHVEFSGDRDPEENVLQVPYNIAWMDFQLMLRLMYDVKEIVVKYQDDDNDFITIGSQEELFEAFKIAQKFENTLNILVMLGPHQDDPIPRPEVRTITVFDDIEAEDMPVTVGNERMSVTAEPSAPSAPDAECGEQSSSSSMEDTMVNVPSSPDTESINNSELHTESSTLSSIQGAEGRQPMSSAENQISMETESSISSSGQCSTPSKQSIRKRLCLIATNKASGKVLDVCGFGMHAGTPLILWDEKPSIPDNGNQMFYIDTQTGTIRCRSNDLCVDVHGASSSLQPYSNAKMSQSWTIRGDRICQCHNQQWNLAMMTSNQGLPVITATDAQDLDEHRWVIKFVDGEYFVAKNIASGLVLDAKGGGTKPGTELILWKEKSKSKYEANRNQLFYEHPDSGTIMSLLNHLTINISGSSTPVLAPYSDSGSAEQWIIDGEKICLRGGDDVVLMYDPSVKGGLTTGTYEGCNEAQHWLTRYLEVADEMNDESGGRAAATAANKAIVEGFWNMIKEREQPRKRKVKSYYSQLARDVGRHNAESRVRSWRSTSPRLSSSRESSVCDSESVESASHSTTSSNKDPPAWFYAYMKQFRHALAEDVATLVESRSNSPATSRTTSVCESAPAASATGNSETVDHPQLCFEHYGVLCDSCDGSVIGVRYKCCNCENFDLCERCEAREGVHDPTHVFLKIRRPTMLVGLNKWGHAEPILRNSIYMTDTEVHGKLMNFARKQEVREEKKKLRKMKEDKKKERKEMKAVLKAEKTEEKKEAKKRKKEEQGRSCQGELRKMDSEFVRDVTFPDGTHLQPGTKFMKRWIVKNTGTHPWTSKTKLVFLWGNIIISQMEISVPFAEAGDSEVEISAEMTAPSEPGVYQSHMQLSHQGKRFGHRVWCSIVVDPALLLEPTRDAAEYQSLQGIADTQQSIEIREPELMNEDESQVEKPESDVGSGQGQSGDFELVTPHPEMFELLQLSERRQPDVSQTATPNNTPLDLSPPKSPVGELDGVMKRFSTSSVEPVTDSSPDEAGSTMTELVQERIASLGLKPDVSEGIDVDTISTCSEDSDSDSDFYIVPLPDCFNVTKPISNTSSTSIIISKDDLKKKKKTVDDLLWASCKLDAPMLEPESMESNEPGWKMVEHHSADEDEEEFEEAEAELPSQASDGPPVVINGEESGDTPDAGGVAMETAAPHVTTGDEIPTSPAVTESVSYSFSSSSSYSISTASITDGGSVITSTSVAHSHVESPEVVIPTKEEPATPTAECIIREEPSAASPADSAPGTSQTQVKRVETQESLDDVNGNAESDEGATLGQESSTSPPESTSPTAPASPRQPDAFSSAINGVLGVATHAAATAYSTAKDVLQNLQQRNQYVPPQSNWVPPQSTWTPAPETPWIPPAADVVVPAPPLPPIDQLIEMGFANRELNAELLAANNNDLNTVIHELIQRNDTNTWAEGRH